MIGSWTQFCEDIALTPAYYMSGVQKIVQGYAWTVDREDFLESDFDLAIFGYSERGGKMAALKRNYYNHERYVKAYKLVKLKWQQRSYGSAQFPMTGEEKKNNQDFCISSCTVTHYPSGGLKVCIFYRTTEVIKKFGADLVFFKKNILPRFDKIKKIEDVTFFFSNLTLHPMFFPTLLSHHSDPVRLMCMIAAKDDRFHTGICKWMIKYLFEGETSWVQKFSQAKQTHAAMNRLMDKNTREELREYFDEYRKSI